MSALLLAKGFVDDMGKVVMIETESGRGEIFADDSTVGGYQVLSLRDNFSPMEYGKAIDAVNKSGAQALIVDSASHEWEGVGGVLSMAADNEAAGKKGQSVWQRPKIDHQTYFMLRLMQTPIPLVIVCMRAKYPMEQVVIDGKKEWQRSKKLAPKQSDDILFEMMVHGWVDDDHKWHATKYSKEEFKQIFVDKQRIDVDTGARLAEWAKGIVPAIDEVMSAAILTDLTTRIKKADTLDKLQFIGNEFNKQHKKAMTEEDKAVTMKAYQEKKTALTTGA